MTLRGWTWDAAVGPAGLGDRPLLEALEAAISDEAVEAASATTGTRERRRRRPRQNPRAVKRKMSNFPLKRPPPAGSATAPARPAPPTIRVLWP